MNARTWVGLAALSALLLLWLSVPLASAQSVGAPTARGEQVFNHNCAGCHGYQGLGRIGPPLAGITHRLTAEGIRRIIQDGRGQMPAWRARLDRDSVDGLLAYLATLGPALTRGDGPSPRAWTGHWMAKGMMRFCPWR